MKIIGKKFTNLEEKAVACESQFNGIMELIKKKAKMGREISEVEKEVFRELLKLGKLYLEVFLEECGKGNVGGQIETREGTILSQEGTNSRKYISIFGEVTICRSYYLNKGEMGFYPLDANLNLPERSYSYLLQEWGLKMCAKETFDEAIDNLEDMLGIKIPKRSLHILTQKVAKEVKEFYREEEIISDKPDGDILVVCVDGKGIPMRKSQPVDDPITRLKKGEKRQKKKQALVGSVYTVKSFDLKEDKKEPRSCNKSVIAQLENKEDFPKHIKNLCKDKSDDIKKKVFLADGQRSLWEIWRLHFTDYVPILDFYHVTEYLWKAAYLFLPESSPEAKKWVENKEEQLLLGKVGRVIGGLRQMVTKGRIHGKKNCEQMNKIIGYFEGNKERMRYNKYIKEGFPIGSGAVESTCKNLVMQRMEGSGMRWNISGAQSILDLRAVHLNNDWKRYFHYYRKKSYDRLYGEICFIKNESFRKEEISKPAA